MIRTPDQRLRVFVSSTLGELAEERAAARRAIERLHLSPVMFELGARPHPPRDLYRAYLEQSQVFLGIYGERYGWIATGEEISGLEDEYRLAGDLPQLVYIREPAPERDEALTRLLRQVQSDDRTSYRRFRTPAELEELVSEDLAVMLSERFGASQDRPLTGPHLQLPAVPTSTIGRESDVARVLTLIDRGARMVTVTGPGGVGKTRLALEVAHAYGADRDEPVHFVPLAAITDPGLVMATIADQVGVREISGLPPVDWLAAHCDSSATLLVLDNLEQVVESGPEIAHLLERTSGATILATSRQPLRIRGEREVVLEPLPTPERGVAVAEVERAPAVQLLVDRAQAAGRRFQLTDDTAADVAELSRRLGGLPLALELVAARLRLLRPDQLLERVGSMLDVAGTLSDLPQRQQTLRATLDWSHDLLSTEEQRLFADLGVFAGGATLDAIERVCGDPGTDVLDTLAGLLDKSLVITDEPVPGSEPRFRMLVPVAQYARERLADSDREAEVRRRHLHYYARLGREAQPFLCGPHQREWAARLDAERPNLRAAIETGFRTGDAIRTLRLVWDTFVYFFIRDAIEEPRAWVQRLAAGRSGYDDAHRAMLDVALVVSGQSPDDRPVIDVLRSAVDVLDESALPLEAAVGAHHLGLRLWAHGDQDAALSALEDASRRYAALDHDWGVATVEATEGAVLAALGEPTRATTHHERSLRHSRRIANRPLMAQALQGLAMVAAVEGKPDEAEARLTEALAIVLPDRMRTVATYCCEALAGVALAGGDAERAAILISAARSTRDRLYIPEWTAAADAAETLLARTRKALSAEALDRAWREGADRDVFVLLEKVSRDGIGDGAVMARAT
jgi:predicted ATPase